MIRFVSSAVVVPLVLLGPGLRPTLVSLFLQLILVQKVANPLPENLFSGRTLGNLLI